MNFGWYLLLAVTWVSAMQNSAVDQPTLKKYSCCPDGFGYLGFLHMYLRVAAKKNVRLTTYDETRQCDDKDYEVKITGHLFSRLFLVASKEDTEQAKSCLQILRQKLVLKKIIFKQTEYTCITKKDLLHRLLPHISVCHEESLNTRDRLWQFTVSSTEGVILEFLPCIHRIKEVSCWFSAQHETTPGEFWLQVSQNIPSLSGLALQVVKLHHLDKARKVLPAELVEKLNES